MLEWLLFLNTHIEYTYSWTHGDKVRACWQCDTALLALPHSISLGGFIAGRAHHLPRMPLGGQGRELKPHADPKVASSLQDTFRAAFHLANKLAEFSQVRWDGTLGHIHNL